MTPTTFSTEVSGGLMDGAPPSDRAVAASPSSPSVSPVPASIPDADEEWRGTKAQREALRQKFGGRCAYCGGELGKAMHADHMEPVIRVQPSPWNGLEAVKLMKPERNTVGNMMPACAPCNIHKGGYPLEAWRAYIQRSADIVRRQTSTFRAGERFGVITVSNEPVVFYFEREGPCPSCDGGFPMYGVAPHECFWRKGPQFTIGQSTLLPIGADDCFVPDLEDDEDWSHFVYPSACGTFYCPDCQQEEYEEAWQRLTDRIGLPPDAIAQAIEAGTAETQSGSVHESAVPEGDASNPVDDLRARAATEGRDG